MLVWWCLVRGLRVAIVRVAVVVAAVAALPREKRHRESRNVMFYRRDIPQV